MIHLICGLPGAGKSTYAQALAERDGGLRFSIDEWMTALYWPDAPATPDGAWAAERAERCYRQIWAVAAQMASRGRPSVLDLGFTDLSLRARFSDLARETGLRVRLHWIDTPSDERWRRVEKRNAGSGPTRHLPFEVTRELFDVIEGMWEPPSEAEMAALDGVRVVPS